MECPMCFELYNEEDRIPRFLICGHTYCESCLNIVYKKKKRIECAMCRVKQDPKIKPSDLSKNYVAVEISSKQLNLQKKLKFCPEHKEPLQFYCYNDEQNFCIQCITSHSQHKFIKQEHSVPLLKEKVCSVKQKLSKKLEETRLSIDQNKRMRFELERKVKKEHQRIDEEIHRMILVLQHRSIALKKQLNEHIQKHYQQMDQQVAVYNSIQQHLEESIAKLQEMEKSLEKTKVIKDSKQLGEVENVLEDMEEITKKKLDQVIEDFEIPILHFENEFSKELEKYGHLKIPVRPKICFFGQRKKLLYFDIEKQIWNSMILPNSSSFNQQLNFYSAACSLPNGDIIITGGGSSNLVYQVSFKDKIKIFQRKPMIHCRKEHSCVLLSGCVYVISGYDGKNKMMHYSRSESSGCQMYDQDLDQWNKIANIMTPRCAFAASSIMDRYIYVFGGYDGHERLKSIEKYDKIANSWTMIATELKFPLSNSAAISYQETDIIVVGGGYHQGFSHEVLNFNIEKNEFNEISKMSEGRDLRNKVIQHKGLLYTIGGNSFAGEKLYLRKGKWQIIQGYGNFVTDNLDSWCCALSYQTDEKQIKYNMAKKLFLQHNYAPNSGIQYIDQQGSQEYSEI